jgi:hypothetical protein
MDGRTYNPTGDTPRYRVSKFTASIEYSVAVPGIFEPIKRNLTTLKQQ